MTDDGSEIQEYDGFSIEYRDASHRYWIWNGYGEVMDEDGNEELVGERTPATSVTAALGILDKPALRKWQGNVDSAAVLQLERDGELRNIPVDKAIYIARQRGLGAEALRDSGAERGTAVHEALRAYCSDGKVPALGEFSEGVRGYVQGLCAWLIDAEPEPIITERIVGSPTHGFAGRLDLICEIQTFTSSGCELCAKGGQPGWLVEPDGKTPCHCLDFRKQRTLIDLKTSANAHKYPESHIQLAGYQVAFPECGIEPVEAAMVLSVDETGAYQTAECKAEQEDFLAVLSAHRAVARVRSALKK
jgi:hypothetical protein